MYVEAVMVCEESKSHAPSLSSHVFRSYRNINQQSLQKFATCLQHIAQLLECPVCLEFFVRKHVSKGLYETKSTLKKKKNHFKPPRQDLGLLGITTEPTVGMLIQSHGN
uniref:Uncharacterized protein n=1 Tax=Glossina austeni TaxID=7395 RepID=A0A1A9UZW1_GLOAU